MIDACKFHQCFPKVQDKEFVMVSDKFKGQSILTEPFVEEYCCEFLSSHVGFAWRELDISIQSVGHGDDGIKTVIFG